MAQRNEHFGRLLKAGVTSIAMCEGKTSAAIDRELGDLIGVADSTIERYKSGVLPPEARTVEILAEVCVRRGLHNDEWLAQFLNAARYPAPERLFARLISIPNTTTRPSRIYHNLPSPSYTQFVARQAASDEVIDGLCQRTAAVIIVGLGGSGKTSLAHEVAVQSLESTSHTPQMDAVVWISDKDHPGTTNMRIVLDDIARTLDFPSITQLDHEEKRREVENLLRQRRVLIVVDNAETITDEALIGWLLRLPEPSKALITAREYLRTFRRGGWPVDLRGMNDDEAQALITQTLRALKMEKLNTDPVHFSPLIAATGGNPKAIEMTLGLVKYERRPLAQVVDDLYAARGKLFEELFQRAWGLLDEAARRVLLVLTLFPTTASTDALSQTADVTGFAFDRSVERLSDLALLDEHRVGLQHPVRYSLHALVRAFATARLAETPTLETAARERWLDWAQSITTAPNVWAPSTWVKSFIPEAPIIDAALEWSMKEKRYAEVSRLGPLLGRFYSLQGLWSRLEIVRNYQLVAARQCNDTDGIVYALRNLLEIKALQGDLEQAEYYYVQLRELQQTVHFSPVSQDYYRSAAALYYLERGEAEQAYAVLQQGGAASNDDPQQWDTTGNNYPHRHQRTWHYYLVGRCLALLQQPEQAYLAFQTAYAEGQQGGYKRGMVFALLGLSTLALDRHDFSSADALLNEAYELISKDYDRRMLAPWYRAKARLHCLLGEMSQARDSLEAAIDHFDRLGIRRDLAEARGELAVLYSTNDKAKTTNASETGDEYVS